MLKVVASLDHYSTGVVSLSWWTPLSPSVNTEPHHSAHCAREATGSNKGGQTVEPTMMSFKCLIVRLGDRLKFQTTQSHTSYSDPKMLKLSAFWILSGLPVCMDRLKLQASHGEVKHIRWEISKPPPTKDTRSAWITVISRICHKSHCVLFQGVS